MTPTPETDRHIYQAGNLVPDREVVFVDFARHLERERDARHAALAEFHRTYYAGNLTMPGRLVVLLDDLVGPKT